MAVSSYEENGKTYWQVYVDIRSRKDRRIRVQKRINGLTSEKEALAEEKKVLRELSEKLSTMEAQGLKWRDVIDRWGRYQEIYPTKRYARTTIEDYCSLLRNWTGPWLPRVASELNRGDGREIIRHAQAEGKNGGFCKHLKNTISLVYTWGIEEKLINGVHETPVHGMEIEKDREEKVPEVLTIIEIRDLLRKAKEQQHPWYPVWVTAVYTGCRSGELQALKRSDVEIISREDAIACEKLPPEQRRYGLIRIRKNWNTRLKELGPTKAGYWRSVPVSSDFYWFLVQELKIDEKKSDDPLLPPFSDWRLGMQAMILRGFCQANSIPSIKFHTLRACFATQLIASGIPATVVMKICGWKDMKTMQRYIRLAGIDEGGATERLKFIPTDEAVMEKVVSLFDFKNK
ncbi:site-specific integrase [Bdellovibrionota bacterium FG-2]